MLLQLTCSYIFFLLQSLMWYHERVSPGTAAALGHVVGQFLKPTLLLLASHMPHLLGLGPTVGLGN